MHVHIMCLLELECAIEYSSTLSCYRSDLCVQSLYDHCFLSAAFEKMEQLEQLKSQLKSANEQLEQLEQLKSANEQLNEQVRSLQNDLSDHVESASMMSASSSKKAQMIEWTDLLLDDIPYDPLSVKLVSLCNNVF